MGKAEDQREFEDMVKAREKDIGSSSAGRRWMYGLICLGLAGSLFLYIQQKRSFDATSEFANSKSETLKGVHEELWGKPDESINKLPQSN